MNAGMPVGRILAMIRERRRLTADVDYRVRVRRALVQRYGDVKPSDLGTNIVAPYESTQLALRTMMGEPAKAVQHYANRLSANQPQIIVSPVTVTDEITATADRHAAAQEKLDAQLWDENRGAAMLQQLAWTMSMDGVGYIVTMPADATFGAPEREYFDATDADIERLKREGKLSPMVKEREGRLIYAEHGDVWADRRKRARKQGAIDGRRLFTLRAYPRDMVACDRDIDGLRWGATIESILGSDTDTGSDLAMSWARTQRGVSDADAAKYRLFRDEKGRIVGGIPEGAPSSWSTSGSWTLINWYSRIEHVVIVCGDGSLESGVEVYRGRHNCTVQGQPECPIEEVPFYRTDVVVPGQDFSTPLEQVFAYVPIINQLVTLRSNAAGINLIPRWVIESKDGSGVIRGDDGEPLMYDSEAAPGLDPKDAAVVAGTIRQLTVETADTDELLALYLESLAKAMPAPVTEGIAGASAPAYQVRQLIQQSQENLRQPSDNICYGVKRVAQRWHGWLSQLDTPIYFLSAPGHRPDRRAVRGLIEFDPQWLSDAIYVKQELDTASDRTIQLQVGAELLAQNLITPREYYEVYAGAQDAREAELQRDIQIIKNIVMYGIYPPGYVPGAPNAPMPVAIQLADGVRGDVQQMLIEESSAYAVNAAQQMLAQASQQAMAQQMPMGMGPEAGGMPPVMPGAVGGEMIPGNVATQQGVRQPGMGAAPTIDQQLGAAVPGGMMAAPSPGMG